MARTFIDQPTQIFNSNTYNDAFASGVQLVSSSTNIEDDLNAIRTQIRQLLWAGVAGNWYDGVEGVENASAARGLNTLNESVTTIEYHRFIYDVQSPAFVTVPSGSNFVGLTVSGSTAPLGLAAVGLGDTAGTFTGSIVATLPGAAWQEHSLNLVSGTSSTTPRNMVAIRDAYTHHAFTDSENDNQEVFGLLQIDSGAADGQEFSDSSPGRTQISFVVQTVSGTIVEASAGSIGGKIINYTYRKRSTFNDLPDDAYVNAVFVDVFPQVSGGTVNPEDVTLQQAITSQGNTQINQGGFFTNINLASSGLAGQWAFLSGSQTLWRVLAASNTVVIGSNNLHVNSSNPASFLSGISVATGSSAIDIGLSSGVISTRLNNDLILSGGSWLKFSDAYGPQSNYTSGSGAIPLSTGTVEWNSFVTNFGDGQTILGALNYLSSSLSASVHRVRASAGVTGGDIDPDDNVTYPTNIDAPLLSYVGRDFINDVNVYLNGILLLPGSSSSDPNDVYPGDDPSSGDLKFPMKIRSGSIISVELF